MPSISVVIPTFNRAELLQRAIESALLAGSDLEVIVVDDCSTDDTAKVCAGRTDIRYLRLSSNHGLAYSRNAGIAESSSEFVAFLDDDDLRLPGSLERQRDVLTADHNASFCYGQALLADSRRQLPTGEIYPPTCPKGDIFWSLLEDNFIPMPSVLTRRSSLIEKGCFNTDLHLIEDWDMWLRLSEDFSITAVDEPVAIYRKAIAQSDQMSSNAGVLWKQALRVQQMALSRPRALAADKSKRRHVRRKLSEKVYEVLMAEATNSIREGDIKSARANLLDAFCLRPARTLASGSVPWLLISPR